MFSQGRKKQQSGEIAPDEIFLDSSNLPEFDTHQFEGRIEKPIPKYIPVILVLFFIFIQIVFAWKLGGLQIEEGSDLRALADNNRLNQILFFNERGIVFSRNGEPLIWNEPFEEEKAFSKRRYIQKDGFGHLLGYIRYPQKDSSGFYYQEEIVGEEGIEASYNDILRGENGVKLIETNALNEVVSQSTLHVPQDGKDLTLAIDVRIQEQLFKNIKNLTEEIGFSGGAGVLMDIENGEVLSLVSYPEYDSEIISSGENSKVISSYRANKGKPFLNRAVRGLYAPGSIVKPILALAALEEGVIDPYTKILSTGSISVPNPYFPDKESVFLDWKAHGLVDLRKALAVSSNVYFYEVGGGYEEQRGIGIGKIVEYMHLLGIGRKTGIDLEGEVEGLVPSPSWKKETFNDEWRIGDTYNTSIGQYGFQISPLHAVVIAAAIANDGFLITPSLVKRISGVGNVLERKKEGDRLSVDRKYFRDVREGMRMAVTDGTAKGLFLPNMRIAAKTGTAQIGISKKRVNSWIIGFFPYENPRYAFSVVMERGPEENLVGALFVMRQLFEWMSIHTPEYLKD